MNAKEAVAIAMEYVRSFPELFPSTDARLEETELEENGNWAITLSFSSPDRLPGLGLGGRFYKRFEINENKEVISMKIRNPLIA